jgi:hypothetical protein
MLKNINRNPRRWVDASRRVLVIEGWHPSAPGAVSFNLLVDGEWLGSYETLDGAADAATASPELRSASSVALHLDHPGAARGAETTLRLVPPVRPDDA